MSLSASLAALALSAVSGFGVMATPSAIDNASGHTTYVITIKDTGLAPETITGSLAPATDSAGACRVGLGQTVTWAKLTSSAHGNVITLQPGQSQTYRVHVGQPPAGHTELIAAFIAKGKSRHGVTANAGVGTALRFNEPGTAKVAPCPHKPAASPRHKPIAAVVTSQHPLNPFLPAGMGAVAMAALGAVVLAWRRRARPQGGRHA